MMFQHEPMFTLQSLEEEARSKQPSVSNLNEHYEQLQTHLSPVGASETNKQNANLNNNWSTIKEKVEYRSSVIPAVFH